jgi:hypothetical protein
VDKTQAVRKDRRQISSRWFPDSRYQISAGRLPRDPVQRVALRLARAAGRASRMADELLALCHARRLTLPIRGPGPGALELALPQMTAEDVQNARAKLERLAEDLDSDQARIEHLLEALAEAERRRLRVLDGGRA